MNTVLDNFLVGVLLLASVSYAVYKLGPRTLKRRILQTFSRAMAAAPVSFGLGRVAQKLDTASAAGKTPGACGGCDNCGTESSSEPQSTSASSAEIKVPVAKIGRRTSAL